eukprot:9059353-Pyramimonas_sp.AAC.1
MRRFRRWQWPPACWPRKACADRARSLRATETTVAIEPARVDLVHLVPLGHERAERVAKVERWHCAGVEVAHGDE